MQVGRYSCESSQNVSPFKIYELHYLIEKVLCNISDGAVYLYTCKVLLIKCIIIRI